MVCKTLAAALVLAFFAGSAEAAEKTVALNVDKADCALCAPIVKMTLQRVPGVKTVSVAEATATSAAVATVTFDDTATNVQALVTATTNAGYPSHPLN
jgi:mercuric ion binding protein